MRIISIDTEYSYVRKIGMYVPFIGTSCERVKGKLKARAYEVRTIGEYTRNETDFKEIKKICTDPNVLKILHNGSADWAVLYNLGIRMVPPYFDTMIAAGLINENFETKALKGLATIYLDEPCNEEKELSKIKTQTTRRLRKEGILGKDEDLPWHYLPKDKLVTYALRDPEYTLRLYELFEPKLRKFWDTFELEMSLLEDVAFLYLDGMRLDRKFVNQTLKRYEHEQAETFSRIKNIIEENDIKFYKTLKRKSGNIDKPVEFNPRSPKHKSRVLQSLDVPISITTKSGDLSTDSKILEPFYDTVPFVKELMDFNWYEKQIGTYYRPFYWYHTTSKNDVAHFPYYQSSTKSGRFSAERIHQIPKIDEENEDPRVIRHCFVPNPGGYIVCIDYDQIEMRLFAHYSRSKLLIDDFLNGRDPYLMTAINVGKRLGIDVESMDRPIKKMWRGRGKTLCLGKIYGLGVAQTQAKLKLSAMEALDFTRMFESMYPVKEYINKKTNELYRKGYISLLFDSPLMHMYREFHVPNAFAYRAVNIEIQATAGYILKYGMRRVKDWIGKQKVKTKSLRGCVHDENIFYIDESYKNTLEITEYLTNLMEDRVTFKVPITASAKMSNESWGAAKGVK